MAPVKVYLSWSGERSRLLANALRDWLPRVLQAVEPWLSATDLATGSRLNELHMETAGAAIICVTSSNITSPWINFETGAYSRAGVPIFPLLLDLAPVDIIGPLTAFQLTELTPAGMRH